MGKIMKLTTIADIVLTNGEYLPEGTEGKMIPRDEIAFFIVENRKYNLAYKNLHLYFNEFVPMPDIDTLEEWLHEGGCETPLGNWVEPDGRDEHGFPSWLLSMGYI
jgi:hypothetical protein